jgi:3D-(3,5/4)-trihydroxycyclohexane-1,2-dione acylhydrolase (decyclizing)
MHNSCIPCVKQVITEMQQIAMGERARAIARHGGVAEAVRAGALPQFCPLSLSEALVIGLCAQGVRKFIAVFGHGSTDIADALAAYEEAGAVRTWNVHHEAEASHCAAMLRWHYGEPAAVVTSIGPGALQALAASIAASSNGIGVYYIFGDETTHAEGPNMQAVPTHRQHAFLDLAQAMGSAHVLHTPAAVFTALRRGGATVFHPTRAGPFFLLLPMNVQPAILADANLLEFPERPRLPPVVTADPAVFAEAARLIAGSASVCIKLGGGARGCGPEVLELAELSDAVIVGGARMSGVVPYGHPRFMSVGGSKGSPCGNHAMEHATLAVVVGARAVCQWDCSGTAWKSAQAIINLNDDARDATHYNRTVAILGDARENLRRLSAALRAAGRTPALGTSAWLRECQEQKRRWEAIKRERFEHPVLPDPVWCGTVLTQPAAIRTALEVAARCAAARYFDAGDVQANGFQIVEDEAEGLTYSETGSSYMGFAVSALLAGALADRPVYAFAFTGDGSLLMNPQVLVDGVQHGARGCIVLFDNRRMGAISSLQMDQYQREYKTTDTVAVDYLALASSVRGVKAIDGGCTTAELSAALEEARRYEGLSLVHVPVYAGPDPMGGLGVYGSWNVGCWCEDVQREHHRIGL